MAHGFRRQRGEYVGRLAPEERAVLTSLMQQVHGLLAPDAPEGDVDEFEAMMRGAGLTRLGDELDAPPGDAADDRHDGIGEPGDPDAREGDPLLDRLLPDAHRDDPLLAAEFRRMSAPGLRARKAGGLATAIAALGRSGGRRGDELRLSADEAQAFVVALTDVRLVVGERLSLHTDEDADRLEGELAAGRLDDESAWLVAVYDFLTWLQESLTQAMLASLGDGSQA